MRLVIELDGGQHAVGTQTLKDEARDAFLTRNGYRVLRIWNNDVIRNSEGVLSMIHSVEKARMPPTPDPSPPLAALAGGGAVRREKM